MNILHMKYAVEIAKVGSINKASETLLVAQPNLSRSIKELEADLGISIFSRSAKGMFLTEEGEEFIANAKKILAEIDELEKSYQTGDTKRKFTVSTPRASYISDALANFSMELVDKNVEVFYKETNSSKTIKNVVSGDYKLGIIRYAENYDKYFKAMLDEKGLAYEMVAEFSYCLVMNRESPLAELSEIHFSDLEPYIEIAHADPYVPSLPFAVVKKEELPDNSRGRIFVYERASQFDLMSRNPNIFMWVSPLPDRILDIYGLTQRKCPDNKKLYKDVLIYRKEYKLTALDKLFITEMCNSKRKCMK